MLISSEENRICGILEQFRIPDKIAHLPFDGALTSVYYRAKVSDHYCSRKLGFNDKIEHLRLSVMLTWEIAKQFETRTLCDVRI